MKQKRLIEERKKQRVTQNEMAKLLGVNYTTYSFKENGKNLFTFDEAFIISCKLEKDILELFNPTYETCLKVGRIKNE